jgi:hypothetical protein
MWIQHLFSFIGTVVRIFFDGIGTTILGRIVDVAFASSLAIAVLVKKNKEQGWRGMLGHWRQEYKAGLRFAMWAAIVIYTPVIIWAIGKAVYEDHQYFVDTAKRLHVAITHNEASFSGVRQGLENDISGLKTKCSGFEGANGVLQSQNRDQQQTINNCQTQAIKFLTPEKMEYTILSLSLDKRPDGTAKWTWLVLTNKVVTPVRMTVACDKPISEGSSFMVGNIAHGQPTSHDATSFGISIDNPAWTPKTPMGVSFVYAGELPKCYLKD